MRKLATIRKIDDIQPIEGADAIEVAVVDGWKVVVKKGEFSPGDVAIYFEIDSWIPTELAPFLSKGNEPREYNGVKGERLKTIKLRGQISQGLLIPYQNIPSVFNECHKTRVVGEEDDGHFDVTELLGIQKWEAPVHAQLAGSARGNFPSSVPKTDQERVQNLTRQLEKYVTAGLTFEMTEKLDGSSCTMYLDLDDVFHVCSRNLDLKETEGNSFWEAAKEYGVEAKMRSEGLHGIAIQGELIGNGIQGNKYGLTGHDFYVFDMYDVKNGTYLSAESRHGLAEVLGLKHSPILGLNCYLDANVSVLLNMAEGKSVLNQKTEREGIVFKCIEDPSISFKAISNKFLLKGGD